MLQFHFDVPIDVLDFNITSLLAVLQGNHTGYAVYHSVHDNFYWMSNFGDPDFTRHQATATVWAMAALILTTTPIPLMDVGHYAEQVQSAGETLHEKYLRELEENDASLSK